MRSKMLIVALVSFLMGIFVTYGLLSFGINELKDLEKARIDITKQFLNEMDYFEAYNRVDVKTNNLESFVAHFENGAPIDLAIEYNIDGLKKDLPKLVKVISEIEDPKDKKRAKDLVERSKKSLKDIEFYYSRKVNNN